MSDNIHIDHGFRNVEKTSKVQTAEQDLEKAQSDVFLMQKSVNIVAGLTRSAQVITNQMMHGVTEGRVTREDFAKAESKTKLLKKVLENAEAKNRVKIATFEEKKRKIQQQDALYNGQSKQVDNKLPQSEQQQPDNQKESTQQLVGLEESVLLQKIEGLQQQLAGAHTILDRVNTQIPEINLKIQKAKEQLQSFITDYNRQERELATKFSNVDDNEVERARLQSQYDALGKQLAEHQQQVEVNKQDLDVALALRFNTGRAVPTIELKLAAAQENLDAYREINTLPDNSAELSSLVLKTEEEIGILEQDIAMLDTAIDRATLIPASLLYPGSDPQVKRVRETEKSIKLQRSKEVLQKRLGVLGKKLEAANKKLATLEEQQQAVAEPEQYIAPVEKSPEIPLVEQSPEQVDQKAEQQAAARVLSPNTAQAPPRVQEPRLKLPSVDRTATSTQNYDVQQLPFATEEQKKQALEFREAMDAATAATDVAVVLKEMKASGHKDLIMQLDRSLRHPFKPPYAQMDISALQKIVIDVVALQERAREANPLTPQQEAAIQKLPKWLQDKLKNK